MTRTATLVAVIGSLVLAGCATVPEAPPTGPCRVTPDMKVRYAAVKFRERMREALKRDANASEARILRHGVPAEMNHRPDRLNIHLDDYGQIDGLRCG